MATKNEQIEFVKTLYPHAVRLFKAGGVHPAFVVAQAALETGWKIKGAGNNLFGITKGSWKGPTVLCLTTEYFRVPNKQFTAPERVVSVEHVGDRYRYRVYRLFRAYDSYADCLDDHLALLKKPGYADAWAFRTNPREFARRIVDSVGAKYATAPNYAAVMASTINAVERIVKDNGI